MSEVEVSVERSSGSQAQLTVEVPPDQVESAIEQALRRLAQQVKLPGFRPGKAPSSVVERAVGWEAVRQEAIDELLPVAYATAVEQAELRPVSTPQVSEIVMERGEPFKFIASVVLRPEVTLGDHRTIKVALDPPSASDEDIAETLKALQRRYAQLVDAGDRGIELEDVVSAELTMRHGGELVGTEDQLQEIDLEQGDLLPGMADQLLGAKVGDLVEVTVTLPDGYPRAELRGEMVAITARIKQLQHKELPPLDDNLAAIAGHGEDLAELRGYIREQLLEESGREAERAQEAKALEQLMEMTRVEIPEAMVQGEIDHELRDLEMRLSTSGVTVEQLLGSQGKSLEQFRGEQRQPAIERVKLEMALEEVAAREGLQVSDQELDQALEGIFSRGASKDQRRRAREPLRRELLLGKARKLVAASARGEEAVPQE